MDDLTAWSSLGLLVVTGIYAVLTWKLAKSAKASAESAQQSADAAMRTAATSEASIVRDFVARVVRLSNGQGMVHVTPVGFNAIVHKVDLKLLLLPDSDGKITESTSTTIYSEGPLHVHAGDDAFAKLKDSLPEGGLVIGQALITYSLSLKGETYERLVSIARGEPQAL
ncbi:hypothetical protein [Ornithinimicrobium cavernae]|uniref:hypothetical protein n=1 Tax=Ornithinimicrobium cavernae TaxID=2666047 RepID=UPI000D69371C|nr:hypothetical protein [Ornithinimicrobium cavernae]